MRIGLLILAVFLAGLLASLIGTGTLIAADLAVAERGPNPSYSVGETIIFAGVLMTVVSLPALVVALAVIALPVTILACVAKLPGVLRDGVLLIAFPLLGHWALDGAFESRVPVGITYGVLAAVCWIACLRLLPVFKAPGPALGTAA